MLEAKELRCFVVVAEELSFSRAAERLNIAQPALTRVIKRLEEKLGGRLFERDTRNVSLAYLGQALLDDTRAALGGFESIETKAREVVEGRIAILRIAYMNFVTHDILGAVLNSFQSTSPRTRIELNYLGTLEQRTALRKQQIDVGFMLGPFSAPRIACRTLREEEMMVVMRADHPLSSREELYPADLDGQPIILGTAELWSVYRAYLFAVFERYGSALKIAQEAPTPAAIFSLVSAGFGLTIFPRSAKLYYNQDLVLRRFVIDGPAMTTICAWNTQSLKPVTAKFLTRMAELGFG
jgi:DNA-binding transcriptional LysR family regulator